MTCGLDGMCNGMGACRRYPGQHRVRNGQLRRRHRDARRPLHRRRRVRHADAPELRPYICGATACRTSCATTADCAAGFACIGRSARRSRTAGRARWRWSARRGTASRACAATPAALPRAWRATWRRRWAPAAHPGRDSRPTVASQCVDDGGDDVRERRHLQRRRRLPQHAAGTACGGRELHRLDADIGADVRRRGRVPAADMSRVRLHVRDHGHGAGPPARRAASASRRTRCVAMSCGKMPIGGLCPRGGRGVRVRHLRAGRLLQHRVHGDVQSCAAARGDVLARLGR